MTEGQLKAFTLNLEEPNKDGTELITKEKLKQFNEINGFTDGPALQDEEVDQKNEEQDPLIGDENPKTPKNNDSGKEATLSEAKH